MKRYSYDVHLGRPQVPQVFSYHLYGVMLSIMANRQVTLVWHGTGHGLAHRAETKRLPGWANNELQCWWLLSLIMWHWMLTMLYLNRR